MGRNALMFSYSCPLFLITLLNSIHYRLNRLPLKERAANDLRVTFATSFLVSTYKVTECIVMNKTWASCSSFWLHLPVLWISEALLYITLLKVVHWVYIKHDSVLFRPPPLFFFFLTVDFREKFSTAVLGWAIITGRTSHSRADSPEHVNTHVMYVDTDSCLHF